jgi:hypothetical protein
MKIRSRFFISNNSELFAIGNGFNPAQVVEHCNRTVCNVQPPAIADGSDSKNNKFAGDEIKD